MEEGGSGALGPVGASSPWLLLRSSGPWAIGVAGVSLGLAGVGVVLALRTPLFKGVVGPWWFFAVAAALGSQLFRQRVLIQGGTVSVSIGLTVRVFDTESIVSVQRAGNGSFAPRFILKPGTAFSTSGLRQPTFMRDAAPVPFLIPSKQVAEALGVPLTSRRP